MKIDAERNREVSSIQLEIVHLCPNVITDRAILRVARPGLFFVSFVGDFEPELSDLPVQR
jgi:hypothetical protein